MIPRAARRPAPAGADRPTVVVLMGGPDAERDVSLMSGREVAAALRRSERFDVREAVVDAPDETELDRLGGDVVFPVLHGRWGEGGPLQERLERIGRPYVGSGPRASALAMDKLATKTVLAADDVPTPPARQLRPEDPCDLEPPLVLKPVDDGSSVDLRICRDRAELDAARRLLHPRRGRLLAERFIAGRELTVGVVLGAALPVIEIVPATEFYDYEAKYTRDDTRYHLDPPLPDGCADACRRLAGLAYRRLGCRDLARVDFMLDERGPWFLELNTMPGFTTHSLLPMAAAHAGTPMPELCGRIVDEALRRAGIRSAT
ncbi:MAG: D-alanine--D-alanine ligase family protein [Planctomycetota bacterium]|jgi:D-alanine-D-alanine ligase